MSVEALRKTMNAPRSALTSSAASATDVGFTMPVRVFNKTGNGAGRFVDSARFETDAASWVVAAMADEQTDFAARPDDAAPSAFGKIGELLYDAWSGVEPEQ